ncbi:microtubule-associated serine/threonine-protein kinase 2 isoform X1 [Salmo salar]|uniref:Microtubule-associated serine/threonine-protein kinase 2 isoform X1 n=1 Tax=Salmo salar TaxID=8030 RepID=A0ABM3DUH8_SALSA|nr:microtubule-associated serine/threonine-protein kinase 2 isoform X1 [Salmo salar]
MKRTENKNKRKLIPDQQERTGTAEKDEFAAPPPLLFRKLSNPDLSPAANKTKLHRQLSQDDGRTRRSSMAMTGKQQLLPLSSSMHGRVSQLAWHLPVEPPNNLVRMRNQSLGQSAPSLTAGLLPNGLRRSEARVMHPPKHGTPNHTT